MKAFHSTAAFAFASHPSRLVGVVGLLTLLLAPFANAANVVLRGDVAHLPPSGAARSIALEITANPVGAGVMAISAHQLRATLAGPSAAFTLQTAGAPTQHPYLGPSSAPVATITGARVDAGDISFAGAVNLIGQAGLLRVELVVPDNLPPGVYPLMISPDSQFTFFADAQGAAIPIQIITGGVRIAGRSGDFDFDDDVDALDLLTWQRDLGKLGLQAADENASNTVDAADYTRWRDARGIGRKLGDYDSDQDVDAADYGLWKTQFGSSVPRDTLSDSNNSGMVDAADYTLWRDNRILPNNQPASATRAVPEPAVSAFLVVAAMTGLWRLRTL